MIAVLIQYDDVHGRDYEEPANLPAVPRVGELLGGLPGIDGEIPVTEVCYGLDGLVYVRAYMVDPEERRDRPERPPSEVRSTIMLSLTVEGDPGDAREVVERALETGALHVEIDEHEIADIGRVRLVDAVIVEPGQPTNEPSKEHSHGAQE